MGKRYLFKVFDKDGNYLSTWDDATFSNFRKQINGGLGELVLKTAKKFDHYDISLSMPHNIVEVWVSDVDSPEQKIYSGFIEERDRWAESANQGIDIICKGFLSLYDELSYKSAAQVVLKKNSLDPSAMLKDVVDRVRAEYADDPLAMKLNYSASSVDNTGTTASYSFNASMALEALMKIKELAPSNWYFYAGADNIIKFKQKPASAAHQFTLGRDIQKIRNNESIRGVKNQLLFWNGRASVDAQAISKLYSNAASKDAYGYRFHKETDGRVTDVATANNWGTTYINSNKDMRIKITLIIIDNNIDPIKGYDIESIEPGDSCKILNIPESVAGSFGSNLMITTIDYYPSYAVLEIETSKDSLEREFAKLKRDLEKQQYDSDQQPDYVV